MTHALYSKLYEVIWLQLWHQILLPTFRECTWDFQWMATQILVLYGFRIVLEYSTQVIWTTFMVLLFPFLSLKVSVRCNCMKKSMGNLFHSNNNLNFQLLSFCVTSKKESCGFETAWGWKNSILGDLFLKLSNIDFSMYFASQQ